jgi:hypothetical protein
MKREHAGRRSLINFHLLMLSFLLQPPPPFTFASSAFTPTIREVPDLMTDLNAPSTFTVLIGHTRPGYDLSRIRFQILSSDTRLLQNSQISSRGTGTNRIISALPTSEPGKQCFLPRRRSSLRMS